MDIKWTVESLKSFESEIGDLFNAGKIKAPVHLSDGNEKGLINVFKNVSMLIGCCVHGEATIKHCSKGYLRSK